MPTPWLSEIKKNNEPFWGFQSLWFQARLQCAWAMWRRRSGRPHRLSTSLIVSLTSFPPRFNHLALTIKSLLSQSTVPDKVILWIAHEDQHMLPEEVRDLQHYGLDIEYCDDLKSYKKIIPALCQHPEALIVTADDDLYYWRTWLNELIDSYDSGKKEVLCHRAHKVRLDHMGRPLPYDQWEGEIGISESSKLIMPTGVGGVLYPPGIFPHEVKNREMFMNLCPTADDIWLYWMALMGGATFRTIGTGRKLITWRGSQECALFHTNCVDNSNDEQIKNMTRRYGRAFE